MTRATLLGLVLLAACKKATPESTPGPAPVLAEAGSARVIPRADVATDRPSWFHVAPENPFLDARLDLGALHAAPGEEHALDILVEWPITPGERNDARLSGKTVPPEGARSFERSRVVCEAQGPLSFPLAIWKEAPDGGDVERVVYDPVAERMKSHAWSGRPYGTDVYSLACWIAARKCAGEDAPWPAPPGASFVPGCRL